MRPVQLTPAHVLASAAVPLLFPAVVVDDELYCDGGLRQMVPLSPALHLGARRLLVVSSVATSPPVDEPAAREERVTSSSPLYLVGKALHALFTDGVAADLDRVLQIDQILEAGRRRYGDGFVAELNEELAIMQRPALEPVEVLRLEPSCDVGALAAAHVVEPAFTRRLRGVAGWALHWIADGEPARAGDVLSYLLFDGEFARKLIDLGRADARARHHELVRFFSDPVSS
jgi:NTE family protein